MKALARTFAGVLLGYAAAAAFILGGVLLLSGQVTGRPAP